MTGRMNWARCKPPRPTESKFGPGFILSNGSRTPTIPQDDLGRRANAEMRKWLRALPRRQRNAIKSRKAITPMKISDAYSNNNRGALFINDRRQGENSPDYRGQINIDGVEYWLSGWRKKSAMGVKYLSLSLKPKQAQPEASKQAPDKGQSFAAAMSDEIPFAPEWR
jgi:hypothetical protein